MDTILVTGDRGYIGSTLVPILLQKKYTVVGLDTGYFTKQLDPRKNPRYKRIKKDVRDISEKDLDGIDAVIHLAALSNDPMGSIDQKLTEEINFKGSVKIATLAKKVGVKRFLFSSSCSIYGIGTQETVNEKSPVNPLTAYAKSKVDTEKALGLLSDSDFCVGLLRNSTVYGYSQTFRDDLVVNNFTVHAVAERNIKILSDGTPWRPLIDVRDLSIIFEKFLQKESRVINGKIINIGFAQNNFQVKTILDVVSKCVKDCSIEYTGEHGADTRSYKVSFEKFRKLFPDIEQKWPLEKSVRDLVKHLMSGGLSKKDLVGRKYTRLSVLQNLMDKHKVDKNLYWRKQ